MTRRSGKGQGPRGHSHGRALRTIGDRLLKVSRHPPTRTAPSLSTGCALARGVERGFTRALDQLELLLENQSKGAQL